MRLTHGSLFSGYGGLDLAVGDVLGAETIWHCENDPAAALVLAHHWPDVPNLGDITAVDWSAVSPVDVLSGGFPCQGLSLAGRQAGLADPRSGLWSYFAAAIAAMRPRFVLIENVRGILSTRAGEPIPDDDQEGAEDDATAVRGVDGDGLDDRPGGHLRAAGVVLGELAELGYDATWCGLPASAVGAPHERFRVIFWASPADAERDAVREQPEPEPGGSSATVAGHAGTDPAPDAHAQGWPWDDAQPDGSGGPTTGRGGGASADADPTGREREGTGWRESDQRRPPVAAATGRGGGADAPADTDDSQPSGQPETGQGQVRGTPVAGSRGSGLDWREWAPAVERWERLTGHPAPAPTVQGKRGGRRLNGALSEWMMGLPPGWITAVPGVSNDDACRLAGNGVVPQQAAAAIPWLLATHYGREVAA